MGEKMKNKNSYYEGFNGSEKHIDHIKYGLLNEFGYNINFNSKEQYDENKIIKTECNKYNINQSKNN